MNPRKELDTNKVHTHRWQPAPDLGRAIYRCACGRTGHRRLGREIIAYANPPRPSPEHETPLSSHFGGLVPRLPSLDRYDGLRCD